MLTLASLLHPQKWNVANVPPDLSDLLTWPGGWMGSPLDHFEASRLMIGVGVGQLGTEHEIFDTNSARRMRCERSLKPQSAMLREWQFGLMGPWLLGTCGKWVPQMIQTYDEIHILNLSGKWTWSLKPIRKHIENTCVEDDKMIWKMFRLS